MAEDKKSRMAKTKNSGKSLFDGNDLKVKGKPLSDYNRQVAIGETVVNTTEYVEELRSARQLSDKDYSIRINAVG